TADANQPVLFVQTLLLATQFLQSVPKHTLTCANWLICLSSTAFCLACASLTALACASFSLRNSATSRVSISAHSLPATLARRSMAAAHTGICSAVGTNTERTSPGAVSWDVRFRASSAARFWRAVARCEAAIMVRPRA
ncbi:hypothetical protein Vretifemale_10322, partial [Volvox reticuliferus]